MHSTERGTVTNRAQSMTRMSSGSCAATTGPASTALEWERGSGPSAKLLAASQARGDIRVYMRVCSNSRSMWLQATRRLTLWGFSRGAAIAIDFVNRVNQLDGPPTVRFLGI